jgi:hypothetical protein
MPERHPLKAERPLLMPERHPPTPVRHQLMPEHLKERHHLLTPERHPLMLGLLMERHHLLTPGHLKERPHLLMPVRHPLTLLMERHHLLTPGHNRLMPGQHLLRAGQHRKPGLLHLKALAVPKATTEKARPKVTTSRTTGATVTNARRIADRTSRPLRPPQHQKQAVNPAAVNLVNCHRRPAPLP